MAHPTRDEPGAREGTGDERGGGGGELGRGPDQVPRRQAVTEASSTNDTPGDRTDTIAASIRSEASGAREQQFITIATYNISDGRVAGLESAGRAFKEGGIDIAFVQESKFMDKDHATKRYGPYDILTAATQRTNCGGVSLFHRDSELYSLENARVRGPNIITFELQVGATRYYAIGCYLPPSESGADSASTYAAVEQLMQQAPKESILMVLGDLNVNLDEPRNEQEAQVAAAMDSKGLACAMRHFRVRTRARCTLRGRWTYQRRRGRRKAGDNVRFHRTKPDYFLLPWRERRKVMRCRTIMLPGHNSDHRALVAQLHSGSRGCMNAYRKKMQTCPLRIPRGPMSANEEIFETLRKTVEKPPARDRPENSWIRPGSWALIDSRAADRREGRLDNRLSRRYGRRIRASLKADRLERVRRIGEAICKHLEAGELKEAWRLLNGWYRASTDAPQKRCHNSMERQTREREDLYAEAPPEGDPIPCNVEPIEVEDGAPSDALLRSIVKKLKSGRSKGAAGMRAEDLKGWLAGIEREEEDDIAHAGDNWRLFVQLVQAVWNTGEIPRQLRYIIIVLIPKGNSDE